MKLWEKPVSVFSKDSWLLVISKITRMRLAKVRIFESSKNRSNICSKTISTMKNFQIIQLPWVKMVVYAFPVIWRITIRTCIANQRYWLANLSMETSWQLAKIWLCYDRGQEHRKIKKLKNISAIVRKNQHVKMI